MTTKGDNMDNIYDRHFVRRMCCFTVDVILGLRKGLASGEIINQFCWQICYPSLQCMLLQAVMYNIVAIISCSSATGTCFKCEYMDYLLWSTIVLEQM